MEILVGQFILHQQAHTKIFPLQIFISKSLKTDNCRYYLTFRQEHRSFFNFGRLLLQFIVDMYCKIEFQRLEYLRKNQERLFRLYPSAVSNHILLPKSFVGGPRYMREKYYDGIALVKTFGKPHLFMTMTTNKNWPEIKSMLLENQSAEERPDIVCRVFYQKLKLLLSELKSDEIFGPLCAYIYVVEYQKRGLPHAHLLIWLKDRDFATECHKIDEYISAELPDDQNLKELVLKFMIHGPCHEGYTCFKEGKCTKGYPKDQYDSTTIDNNGIIKYKRRRNSPSYQRGNATINASNVVPYNPYLLKRYNCHINVEICNR